VDIWTVGHSNLALDAFLDVLRPQGIELVADVRTVPKSRRHPQFHTDRLAVSLPAADVGYVHLPGLGGWRRVQPGSPNGGWRVASFQGYADYAMTEPFAEALAGLRALAAGRRTAVMCSEAVWWRCHRRLISDRLVLAGDAVHHIVGAGGRVTDHELTPFAVVQGGQLVYPPS
jgi:uncharacterized protein (DUF488 family)